MKQLVDAAAVGGISAAGWRGEIIIGWWRRYRGSDDKENIKQRR